MTEDFVVARDAALRPLGDVVAELAGGWTGHRGGEPGTPGLSVTSVSVDVPVELATTPDLVGEAPRQPVVTAVFPVMHRMRLRVVLDDDG